MQSRANNTRGGFESRQLSRIDRTALLGVVKTNNPGELAADEDRHDRLGLGVDTFDCRGAAAHLAFAEADAVSGTQLREHRGTTGLVAGTYGRFGKREHTTLRRPFTHHAQQPLAVGPGIRLHEIHSVDACRLADQSQNRGDRGAYIRSFEQQTAGAGRPCEQSLARLQRLVDAPESVRTGRGLRLRLQGRDMGIGIHGNSLARPSRSPRPKRAAVQHQR